MTQHTAAHVATVVLVHSDEDPLRALTLAEAELTQAAEGAVSTVLVDASRDGVHAAGLVPGPSTRVVPVEPGTGLAAARNIGAAASGAPYVAFLAAGARPSAGWLDLPLDLLATEHLVACVAPTVIGRGSWGLSFTGHPVQVGPRPASGPVLFPATEAMVVRRSVFEEVGGFAERYDRFGEEVEFGARLTLLGWTVQACPESVVAPPAEPPRHAAHEARRLAERNALSTVFRLYDERNLAVALPAAMALAVHNGRASGDLAVRAAALGLDDFVASLPALEEERAALQPLRRRSDQELLRLFVAPLAPVGDEETHCSVVSHFRVAEAFGRTRVLVVTPDVLTPRMAGPAIRAWQIASALAPDHDVKLVTVASFCQLSSEEFDVRAVDADELLEMEEWCDILVIQGFLLHHHPGLRRTQKVLVVDIYDPLHLENLEFDRNQPLDRRRDELELATAVLNDQLARGDFFLCASPKQRDFWLGQMAGMGRINPLTYDEDESLHSLLAVVPFGLPDTPPERTGPGIRGAVDGVEADDDVIIWGGGIYNWFDPLTLIRAVDRLRARRPRVRLFFMGLRHPNPVVPEMRMANETRSLSDELGLTDKHVFFNEGWVPYEERQNFLLDADVAVSTHLDHLETSFSFRTRILDYLWAGLPIVSTTGDGFADLIEAEELGVTVPPNDVDALEEALFRLLDDADFAAACRKHVADVATRYRWSVALRPLVDFCRAPRRAPDLVDPRRRRTEDVDRSDGATPIAETLRPAGGLRADLRHALFYARTGGPKLVLRRAASRMRRVLAGR